MAVDMQNVSWPGWEIVRVIGHGGFGTVYEIQRDIFGKMEKAALKVISIPQSAEEIEELYSEGYDAATITDHFRDYLEDVIREYSLMLGMKGHTNVVYCDDLRYVQHEDGIGWDIYIKMELLTPLMKALDKTYDERQTIRLGLDLCNALSLCRRENIVHRDIKPQNIFVSRTGDYKLGDFGVAKISEKTASGTKIGTYEYMAPEVYRGQAYGGAADIYSLGLVMYWMMNERRTPFLPQPPQMPSVSAKEEARSRRFAGEALPAPQNGSEALRRIVLKACAFAPKDRYASPEQMRAELEKLERSCYGEESADMTVRESVTQKTVTQPRGNPYRVDPAQVNPQNWQTKVEQQPAQPQGNPYRMDAAQINPQDRKVKVEKPSQAAPQGNPYRTAQPQGNPQNWQTKVEQPAQPQGNPQNWQTKVEQPAQPQANPYRPAQGKPQNPQPAPNPAAAPNVDAVLSYNEFQRSPAGKKQNKGCAIAAAVALGIGLLIVVISIIVTTLSKPEDGFQEIDGSTYYYRDGEAHTGWLEYNMDTYYFAPGGQMVTGARYIDGETYYFFENGRMATGEVELVADTIHVFDEEGRFQYRLICTRYPTTTISEEEVEFSSGTDSTATGQYNLLDTMAMNCVSVHFRAAVTEVAEGTPPTNWAMRIRGELDWETLEWDWEKVANFEMYNNVGNCYVTFEEPVNFDAFIANGDEDCEPWSGIVQTEILEMWCRDDFFGLLDETM